MPGEQGSERTRKACEEVISGGEVAFSTFVVSMGTSCLYHLGLMAHPESGKVQVNLPMARHVIEILAMLKRKTKGNLEEDEERLIDQLLFDLRLKYVNACQKESGNKG